MNNLDDLSQCMRNLALDERTPVYKSNGVYTKVTGSHILGKVELSLDDPIPGGGTPGYGSSFRSELIQKQKRGSIIDERIEVVRRSERIARRSQSVPPSKHSQTSTPDAYSYPTSSHSPQNPSPSETSMTDDIKTPEPIRNKYGSGMCTTSSGMSPTSTDVDFYPCDLGMMPRNAGGHTHISYPDNPSVYSKTTGRYPSNTGTYPKPSDIYSRDKQAGVVSIPRTRKRKSLFVLHNIDLPSDK